VGVGWVDVWMNVSVGVWCLGGCVNGFVGVWVVVGWVEVDGCVGSLVVVGWMFGWMFR